MYISRDEYIKLHEMDSLREKGASYRRKYFAPGGKHRTSHRDLTYQDVSENYEYQKSIRHDFYINEFEYGPRENFEETIINIRGAPRTYFEFVKGKPSASRIAKNSVEDFINYMKEVIDGTQYQHLKIRYFMMPEDEREKIRRAGIASLAVIVSLVGIAGVIGIINSLIQQSKLPQEKKVD